MLFNSYEFLFAFLPVVLIGYILLGPSSQFLAALWLALASLFFYGWWDVTVLPLLLVSICLNYLFGAVLSGRDEAGKWRRKAVLWLAVGANLATLGFFKYADFFIDSANGVMESLGDTQMQLVHIVLPIGISFYTFTQIAFLVDCYQGKVQERRFIHYVLFVTYFPHLIAGPVLHHKQMMPQFARASTYRLNWGSIALGTSIFTIGLAKKLVIADPLGGYADALFSGVRNGGVPAMFTSWGGVLAYTYQIYFDFSGYSDMAIGLSLLFGVTLPINFNHPYRAENIADFWRRWHISLSNFLRDYLYVPLGGNRRGTARRYVNLLVTMLLGGLWHGANWTFVLWGGIHGALLAINHWWRASPLKGLFGSALGRATAWALTFLCVCLAWVPFRAHCIDDAWTIYKGMFGGSRDQQSGASLLSWQPAGTAAFGGFFDGSTRHCVILMVYLAVAAIITRFAIPEALRRWTASMAPSLSRAAVSVALGALLAVCIGLLARNSPFLYFQF